MSKRNLGEISDDTREKYLQSVKDYNPPVYSEAIPYVQDEAEKKKLDAMVTESKRQKKK
jgi:hypothetical protein